MLATVYLLSIAAIILAVTTTPDAGEYVKGLRRALREGKKRASPWSDGGSSRLALFLLCALLLGGTTTVVNVVGRPTMHDSFTSGTPHYMSSVLGSDEAWLTSRRALLSRPIAVGVLTAAYIGLAFQYFSLRTRSSGLTLLALLVFAAWLLPLIAGAIIALGPRAEETALVVVALSPILGIGLSTGLGQMPRADSVQLAAIAPPVTLAFLFNYLLVITQRKLDRLMHAQEKEKEKEKAQPENDFAGKQAAVDDSAVYRQTDK
jgi:hypothetical protein